MHTNLFLFFPTFRMILLAIENCIFINTVGSKRKFNTSDTYGSASNDLVLTPPHSEARTLFVRGIVQNTKYKILLYSYEAVIKCD